jgi:hypothetical protein
VTARPVAARKSVAVVVPAYRPELSHDELLSLRHLEHYLPDAVKVLAMPEGLDLARPGYRPVRFRPAYFASLAGYNRLMLSREFYARFEEYEFVLIHQLDALVLSADLGRFLSAGVDYLGAPFVDLDAAGTPVLAGVGNGGLSLRRVGAFRRLLESRIRTTSARAYYREGYTGAPLGRKIVGLGKAAFKGLGIRNSIRREIDDSLGNEDDFLAAEATRYSPGFAIGSIDLALEFAFEEEPRYCYARAGERLPFGAHAWSRYDRAFWEPYLLR